MTVIMFDSMIMDRWRCEYKSSEWNDHLFLSLFILRRSECLKLVGCK